VLRRYEHPDVRARLSTGTKHERALALVEELWQSRAGVVSTQVLQELAVNLRRKAKRALDAKATRDVVADYLACTWSVNNGDSILEALDLETRHRVSFWDALVLQAAQASGARFCTLKTSPTAALRIGPGCESVHPSLNERAVVERTSRLCFTLQVVSRRITGCLSGATRCPRSRHHDVE